MIKSCIKKSEDQSKASANTRSNSVTVNINNTSQNAALDDGIELPSPLLPHKKMIH